MSTIDKFEDLIIWQESKVLTITIYKIFSDSRDFGFKDQIQRASVSIMNNIAEGFERSSDKDFARFLFIAKASAGEVRSMLYLASELKYIDLDKSQELITQVRKLAGSIGNFIKYLKKSN
jgi:four helix bundle protein